MGAFSDYRKLQLDKQNYFKYFEDRIYAGLGIKKEKDMSVQVLDYTFTNGLKVTGTVDQIMAVAKSLGLTIDASKMPRPTGFYNSSTKGLVRIRDMQTNHIKNALCRSARSYYEGLTSKPFTTGKAFCSDFMNLATDPLVNELFAELQTR